jgi:hypothetical protein
LHDYLHLRFSQTERNSTRAVAMNVRNILTNALLLVASLALSLGIGEMVVRLLFKDQVSLNPRYHTDYGYGRYKLRGIRPNSEFWHTSIDGSWRFVTNSRGFRNETDFSYEKPGATLRILSLGDSQTQGYEVRQSATYSAVLERYLTARGKSAQVLNAGVSGFSTAEALAFLENEGYKYQPDVVVLGFFANDFKDNMKAALFALDKNGHLAERGYEHLPGVRIQNFIYWLPFVPWLSENSYFYSMVFNAVWAQYKQALTARATSRGDTDVEDPFEYAVAPAKGPSQAEISLAEALIVRMDRFCRAHGIRLIVVDIPSQLAGPHRFKSSLPASLLKSLVQEQVELVPCWSYLLPFDGAVEFHVPHGKHHISEFTHTMISVELGRRILGGSPQSAVIAR